MQVLGDRVGRAYVTCLVWLAIGCLPCSTANGQTLNQSKKLSLIVGSFVYHAHKPHEELKQYFQNHLMTLQVRLPERANAKVFAGPFINSLGNRCFLLGAQKNWHQFDRRTTFEGVYAYAGEFFFDTFANRGAAGIYRRIKRATGLGFAPYLYHGVEFDLSEYASLQAGVIAPGIVMATVQWHF